MDVKEEDILGKNIYNHWYYVSKGRAMKSYLGDIKAPEVLDVGAGSGIFSRQLIDAGICNRAVCLDPNYTVEKSELYNGKQLDFVKSIDISPCNLILMMDVLEHVEDDEALLRYYTENMATGGYVFITVPAFNFMWSGHDVFLEHHRRYTIKKLESVVKQAGLTPLKSRYFFASLFPLIAVIRLVKKLLLASVGLSAKSDLKLYPKWINRVLIAIHDIERVTIFSINKWFGLSVYCLCRKD